MKEKYIKQNKYSPYEKLGLKENEDIDIDCLKKKFMSLSLFNHPDKIKNPTYSDIENYKQMLESYKIIRKKLKIEEIKLKEFGAIEDEVEKIDDEVEKYNSALYEINKDDEIPSKVYSYSKEISQDELDSISKDIEIEKLIDNEEDFNKTFEYYRNKNQSLIRYTGEVLPYSDSNEFASVAFNGDSMVSYTKEKRTDQFWKVVPTKENFDKLKIDSFVPKEFKPRPITKDREEIQIDKVINSVEDINTYFDNINKQSRKEFVANSSDVFFEQNKTKFVFK